MLPASSASDPHFSTSRIHRLLRPLRNKCSALTTFTGGSLSTSLVTYASQPTSTREGNNFSPLDNIPPPDTMNLRLHFDRSLWRTRELSQKIYAIRDSFRNIVHVAFGSAHVRDILSLREICAIIIGENMELDDEEEIISGPDEDSDLTEINELYDAVPLHYRRWSIISHALSLILRICPHHPTLLYALLEVVSSYGLLRESSILLHSLLVVAVSPNPSSFGQMPPLHAPQHSAYLSTLREVWVFTDRAFSNILVDVLLSGKNDSLELVWTSKAMARLVSDLNHQDFVASVRIVTGLVEALINAAGCRPEWKQIRSTLDIHSTGNLPERLAKWLDLILDSMLAWNCSFSKEDYEKFQTVSQLLLQLRDFHLQADLTTCPGLRDAFLCLATWSLTLSLHHKCAEDDMHALLPTLCEIKPRTSTYDYLIGRIAASSAGLRLPLQACGDILRSHGLLRLEASLWGCAVTHLDSGLCQIGRDDILREEIMERVDDAERRCFGHAGSPEAFSSNVKRKQSREWEWEEMVGGWVRRSNSPVAKRARIGAWTPRPLTGRRCSEPESANSVSPGCSPLTSKIDSYADDKENTHISYSPWISKPAARRPSNFRSIVGDALKNRAVLHPECFNDSSNLSLDMGDDLQQEFFHASSDGTESYLSSDDAYPVLASDDALNMFMYENSSPAFKSCF